MMAPHRIMSVRNQSFFPACLSARPPSLPSACRSNHLPVQAALCPTACHDSRYSNTGKESPSSPCSTPLLSLCIARMQNVPLSRRIGK